MKTLILVIIFTSSTPVFADFTLVTWNMKHLGRESLDMDKAATLLMSAGTSPDMLTVQEVNTTKSGAKALASLAATLTKKSGQKYCTGLSERPTDAKERYAFLWKESVLSYVTMAGKEIPTCSPIPITLRLGTKHAAKIIREPAVGFFKEKSSSLKMLIATIHQVPTAKRPELEVPLAFATVDEVAGKAAKIFSGDFNLGPDHLVFSAVAARGYKYALGANVKTSIKKTKREFSKAYDNVFYQGVAVAHAKVLSAFSTFPEMSGSDINKSLSDHMPVWVKILTDPQAKPINGQPKK